MMKRKFTRSSVNRALFSLTCCLLLPLSSLTATAQTASSSSASNHSMKQRLQYPAAAKVEQFDDYHGTRVADPYRWLEDPDSPQSRQWIEAQNKLTFGFLGEIPERAALKERLTQLWNYERYGAPFKKGNRYFSRKTTACKIKACFIRCRRLTPRRNFCSTPTRFRLTAPLPLRATPSAMTASNSLMAWRLQAPTGTNGNVRDVETGRDLSDHVKWVEVFRRVLDQRQQRLFLQPLR
ncbi:MAG: hypothetical protein WKF84_27515 [Pyrinomonadaceae bacterium]